MLKQYINNKQLSVVSIIWSISMVVYGVALLAFCMLTGIFLGDLLGQLIGVDANVGGIGIAMLLLIFIANVRTNRFEIKTLTKSGVNFWSAMYIPIVVAMAAKQNVLAAISGGWMAIIAGVMTVIISFLMIPVLYKLLRRDSNDDF